MSMRMTTMNKNNKNNPSSSLSVPSVTMIPSPSSSSSSFSSSAASSSSSRQYLLIGGGQEGGKRGVTENVPYIVGLGMATDLLVSTSSTGTTDDTHHNHHHARIEDNIPQWKSNAQHMEMLRSRLLVNLTTQRSEKRYKDRGLASHLSEESERKLNGVNIDNFGMSTAHVKDDDKKSCQQRPSPVTPKVDVSNIEQKAEESINKSVLESTVSSLSSSSKRRLETDTKSEGESVISHESDIYHNFESGFLLFLNNSNLCEKQGITEREDGTFVSNGRNL